VVQINLSDNGCCIVSFPNASDEVTPPEAEGIGEGPVIEMPGKCLFLDEERALTGDKPWLPGDIGLPLLVGESDDSEELDVDL
jgi:hypothetical protein